MSVAELEHELARRRQPDAGLPPSGARRLSVEEALAYRNAGNLPDGEGRTLRLLLVAEGGPGALSLEAKRRRYEPDYHEAPTWRRPGSVPVNVVPLGPSRSATAPPRPWFEEPEVAALESEWRATGKVAGLRIPAEVRGFVWKTVVSLRSAGVEVSVDSVAASLARWMSADDLRWVRAALEAANRRGEAGPAG
jgi:hypothetical protein